MNKTIEEPMLRGVKVDACGAEPFVNGTKGRPSLCLPQGARTGADEAPRRFRSDARNGRKLLFCCFEGVHVQFHAGDGSCAVAGDDDVRLGFQRDFVFHTDQDGVGANLSTESDARFAVNGR